LISLSEATNGLTNTEMFKEPNLRIKRFMEDMDQVDDLFQSENIIFIGDESVPPKIFSQSMRFKVKLLYFS